MGTTKYGSGLQQGDTSKILGVQIDDTLIGDGKRLVYNSTLAKLEYMPTDDRLAWRLSPTSNGSIFLLGWYIQTDTGVSLITATPINASEDGFHSHFSIDVSSATGLPFTIRVTGISVSEDTGVTTGADTEDIAVTANGFYQTTKSWIDDVQFSIVEATKTCTLDIFRSTYWDHSNTDFILTGSRLEWTPDSPAWDITVTVSQIENDGSLTTIDTMAFASTDGTLRANNAMPGKYKRTDYNLIIDGSAKEGLIVDVDQTGIGNFLLEVKFDD